MEYSYIAFPIVYHWFTNKDRNHFIVVEMQLNEESISTNWRRKEVHLLNAWRTPKKAGYMCIYYFFLRNEVMT